MQRAFKESQEAPEDEGSLDDPSSMSEDGASLFLDKTKFPGGCKPGDVVMIKATVKAVGSKVEFTPDEVTPVKGQAAEGGEEQEDQEY